MDGLRRLSAAAVVVAAEVAGTMDANEVVPAIAIVDVLVHWTVHEEAAVVARIHDQSLDHETDHVLEVNHPVARSPDPAAHLTEDHTIEFRTWICN